MKNKAILKIALILIIIMTLCVINNVTYATDRVGTAGTTDSTDSPGGSGNFNFENFEGKTADATITKPVNDALGAVLNVIRIVGTGIAIIILAVVAIKYMTAAPSDRADFKKGAIQYVVGAVILFGAVNLMNILVNVIPSMV